MTTIKLKRVYEDPASSDGQRILVERLWPRGVRKEVAQIDIWLKDIAPSPELRKWYGHQPELWPEFQDRYRAELDANPEVVAELRGLLAQPTTFIYAARDTERNSARLLKAFLEDRQ